MKDIVQDFPGWNVTLKNNPTQLELRKKFGEGNVLLIVNSGGGYNWKFYKIDGLYRSTKGLNIHMAANGPLQMTFDQWDELNSVIQRAKTFLSES